jgi:MFS family permease
MKNRSAIVTLFIANLISGVAQGFTMIAIPWYFARDFQMSKFGLIYILVNVIAFFWVPYAGTFVDRFDRRKIFLVLTITIGSLIGLIAWSGYQSGDLHWGFVAAVFMLTFFNYNIHYPNLYAFVQEITEPRYYNRITSALEIMGQVATMSAGAGSALLLEGAIDGNMMIFGFQMQLPFSFRPWEIYEIFTLDAVTYFIAFFIILMIRYTPIMIRKAESGNVLERLKVGFNFLLSNRQVATFGIASHGIFVTILVAGFYLFPLYVKNHMHASGDVYATLDIYYGLGAIMVGFAVHRLFRKTTIPTAIFFLSILCSVSYLILGLTNSALVLFIIAFVTGICNAGSRVLRVTFLFKHIPNQVFGRSNGIFTMINIVFRIVFLSLFSLPFFLQSNHVIWGYFIFSAFLILCAIVLFQVRMPEENEV